MPLSSVVFVAALLAAVWVAVAFNRLVRHANLVREAWSGIDVQLKRRHDLVPNLVEVVQSYARYERDLMEDVTRLRAGARPPLPTRELQDQENGLSDSLRGVLAVAEAYPELLANRSFLRLQEQLVEIENQLQMARRYYNGTVRDYNTIAEQFPSNLVATLFRFPLQPFFQVESATERALPQVEIDAGRKEDLTAESQRRGE
jgi:LemA protein